MTDFESLYFKLFAAISDAVEHLEEMDYGTALRCLIQAQQEAEEIYISSED